MKTQVKFLLIMWVCTFCMNAAYAKAEEKTITKTFAAGSDYTLNIDNKYGNVNIRNGAQNEISFEIKIEINGKDLLSMLDVKFSESGKTVSAKTVFPSKWNCNNCDLKITYNVLVPKGINLDLENKYGNINLDDVEGVAHISLKYGNLDAGNFAKQGTVEIQYGNIKAGDFSGNIALKYGNGTLRHAGKSKINVKYSKFNINSADELTIESGYSTFNLGETKQLRLYSKYDNYSIALTDDFESELSFTNVTIEKLNKSCHANTKYGYININYVNPDFKSIYLDGCYTNLNCKFDANASYLFEIQARYSNVKTPDSGNIQLIKEKNNSQEIKGTVGSSAKSKVKIDDTYAKIVLK